MKLLTKEQMSEIQAFAAANETLRLRDHFGLGSNPTSVLSIGYNTGIIIFNGNEDTGYEHILLRHSYFSKRAYWDNDGKLESPSKFSPHSIRGFLPIMTYTEIVDGMYDPAFLNTMNNKSPDLFDLYEGTPQIPEAAGRRYRMLLYKGTKILHNLFPVDKKYRVKKPAGFSFQKGEVKVTEDLINCTITVTISYLNRQKIKSYTAVVFYDFFHKTQTLNIIIHRQFRHDLQWEAEPMSYTGERVSGGAVINAYLNPHLKVIETCIGSIEKDRARWQVIP